MYPNNTNSPIPYILLSFALYAVCAGCSSPTTPASFTSFHPIELDSKLKEGAYTRKLDNFLIIVDASSTMNNRYLYEAFESNTVPSLFEVEKEILKRFNQTIPTIDLNAGIRTFGFGPCLSWTFSQLILKPAKYDKLSFDEALDSLVCAGGGSPLDFAIDQAALDLEAIKGDTALIILSDGDLDDAPAIAVFELKRKYAKNICVHTISISEDPANRLAMRRLSALSQCGYTTTAEEIATPEGMAEFVEKTFFRRK